MTKPQDNLSTPQLHTLKVVSVYLITPLSITNQRKGSVNEGVMFTETQNLAKKLFFCK